MIVEIKPHENNLLNVVFPDGQTRRRNCSYTAIPSERRPVGNLMRSSVKLPSATYESEAKAMCYREYKFRRNVFAGLVILLYVVANLYFYIVGLW